MDVAVVHESIFGNTRGIAEAIGDRFQRSDRALRGHGYQMAAKPQGLVVEGMAEPLRKGEVELAREWRPD